MQIRETNEEGMGERQEKSIENARKRNPSHVRKRKRLLPVFKIGEVKF